MPKTGMRQTFQMKTRGISTVSCEVGMTVDGRELPNMAVLGDALEKAIELIAQLVSDSYKVVPPRTGDTPIADPYARRNQE
jgi:hypothetical protein